MSKQIEIFIGTDGNIQGIYSDEFAALFAGEEMTTRRASHVEPAETWCAFHHRERDALCRLDCCSTIGSGWVADLSPVNGPMLGPFDTRQDALDAETSWLSEQMRHGKIEVK